MRTKLILISILLYFFTSQTHAQNNKSLEYSKKSTFELSMGLTLGNSSNSDSGQIYSLGLLPYANHFIFDKWFLRYDFGLLFNYSVSYAKTFDFGIFPGLAAGYSFKLSDQWFLNLSAGYAVFYAWTTSSTFGSSSGGSQHVTFFPEVKYLITERWAVSFTTRITSNLQDIVFLGSKYPRLTTNLYIAASYIF